MKFVIHTNQTNTFHQMVFHTSLKTANIPGERFSSYGVVPGSKCNCKPY